MIKVGKVSKHLPAAVIEKAVEFFGPPGYGLEVIEQGECCALFRGGGGHVSIQTAEANGGKKTQVTVEGREFDSQILDFIKEI